MLGTATSIGHALEILSREAAAIRARAPRASTASQRIMSSEAAAYERAVRLILSIPALPALTELRRTNELQEAPGEQTAT